MAKAKEFTVAIADKPGALGKCFLGLADRGVNILAFQSYVEERESLVRFVADKVATAQAVFGVDNLTKAAALLDELTTNPA